MSNPTELYNTTVRANLPNTITYDSVRNRYVTFNNKYFVTYKEAKWYVDYISKFSSLSEYMANGFSPAGVLDFGREVYVGKNGRVTDASEIVTYGTPGLALMTDSDGNQKWNPHNLLPYSEDISNAAWGIIGAGGSTIDDASTVSLVSTNGLTGPSASTDVGAGYTVELDLWTDTDVGEQVDFGFNTNNGTNTFSSPVTLTSTRTTYSFSKVNNTATLNGVRVRNISTGKTIRVSNVRLYRSDQGGMAPVPVGKRVAGSETYVPTTSSAVYLPRENSYLYDAATSSYINNGLFLESEARENLVTTSDFSAGVTLFGASRTLSSTTGPDGQTSGVLLQEDGATSLHRISPSGGTITSGVAHSVSVFAKAKERTEIRLTENNATGAYVTFNLTDGSVVNSGLGGSGVAENVGNGWYRCTLNFTSAGTLNRFDINLSVGGEVIYAGDGTSGVYIYGAQFEAGSTPSSLIPTAGSTVTRLGQTAVIDSANNPLIEVGPELVTNGGFDTDSDWTLGTGWTISGGLVTHSPGTGSNAAQAIPFTLGQTYIATCDVISVSGGSGSLQFRNGGTTTALTIPAGAVGTTVSLLYVAEGNTDIALTSGAGTTISVSNISVKPLSMPDALSIGLKGKMTYADGGGTEAEFYDWTADSANYVSINLRTQAAATGEVYPIQAAGGVIDDADGRSSQYSPGVNVPFNIASRHGATFINGAADGTALTANTTPTALPDLTAADFEIGPDFMGHIQELTLFDVDVGDTGLEEITE